jgi:hypothetical protein
MSDSVFTSAFLDAQRNIGDPPLDTIVTALCDRNHGLSTSWGLFRRIQGMPRMTCAALGTALHEEGLDAPELVRFFAAHDRVPKEDWIDRKMLRAGGAFYSDRGVLGFMVLAFGSLPACYCWEAEARVLSFTGRLQTRSDTPRRLPETAQMVLDVASKDAFADNGKAIHAANKVRLIHALVRYRIRYDTGALRAPARGPGTETPLTPLMTPAQGKEHKAWDEDTMGAPISQEFLASTLLTFHFQVLEGLRQMGLRFKDEEARAYIHRWNLLGYFLGINTDILSHLQTPEQAGVLWDLTMSRNRKATENGRQLANALLHFTQKNVIDTVTGGLFHPLAHVPKILTHRIAGEDTFRALKQELTLPEMVWYLPVWTGIRTLGFLNNWRLFRRVTDRVIGYAASRVWGWRVVPPGGDVPTDTTPDGGRPCGVVRVPASMAEGWDLQAPPAGPKTERS